MANWFRNKSVSPDGVSIVKDKGEFRPGLYERDLKELRTQLAMLAQGQDRIIDNQVKLDEVMRKVGLAVDTLTQAVSGVDGRVGDEIREGLEEVMNQLVAGQQDLVAWLRRAADKAVPSGGNKDEASSDEEGRRSGVAGKEVAAELRQVIRMVVIGETAKAVEALSAIYSRLDPASEEKLSNAPVADAECRKRTEGVRSRWQSPKRESSHSQKPEIKSNSEQRGGRVIGEGKVSKPEGSDSDS